MVKFLETFLNKLLDFLNVGRLITIIVPGVIVSFCLLMLASQLLFPMQTGETPAVKAEAGAGIKANTPAGKDAQQRPAERKDGKKEEAGGLFQKQVSSDFLRTSNHVPLMVFFTLVIGLMLYEVGYKVLQCFSKIGAPHKQAAGTANLIETSGDTLKRYDPQHDADPTPTNKFNFSAHAVGLVYFAPFLKEKFSGEENYFSFIVTEYYRFVEFSVNMPIAIIVSGLIGVAYYLLFSLRHSCWPYSTELSFFFPALFAFPALFLFIVSPGIPESYKQASKDLIQGVSDLMAKGLK